MLPSLKKSWAGLALALALPLASCAQTQAGGAQAAAAPRPAMWKLADEDTTLYLFGTIHLLPEGRTWRSEAMERALAASDELVLEVANVEDMAAAAGATQKLGLSPGLPPILERVPEDKKAALQATIAASGLPPAVFDRMETWAAAFTLLSVTFARLGLNPELGVEKQISGAFRGAAKKLTGLETIEEQFGFFDGLSEEAQRAFLVSVTEDSAEMRERFKAMLDAWARGDVKGIEATFNDPESMPPALRQALLGARNARWAEWLHARMARPGTVFVAVGAGHLAGADSVQALLRRKGLKAKRVQ
jgi:uncharacterized protein